MSKKVLALVLALVMVIAMLPTVAFAADYADTKGHWAEAQIDRWTDAGVVGGTGTGFNPNGNMTRAEAAQTFVSLLKLTKKADLTTYTDVPTAEWKVEALAKAVQKGIINGMENKTLVPDGQLTREQMFVMIGRALGIKPAETSTKTFVDGKETSTWATGYINALVNMGAIKGVGNDQLKPADVINRASVMSALDQLIGGYANTDGQTVEIVEGKITLIVADDVKVTGTADPEMPIVIAGEAKTVDLEGVTVTGDEAPVVQVQVEEVAIENAPEGTTVDVPAEATDVTVNGETAEPGKEVVVPETTPAPSIPSYTPSAPAEPQPTDHKYTVIFDATRGEHGAFPTTKPDDKTCYGGENWQVGTNKKLVKVEFTINSTSSTTRLGANGLPADPTDPTGALKFECWSTDPNSKNEFTGDTTITAGTTITVYALWLKTAEGGGTCYGGENAQEGVTYSSVEYPEAPIEFDIVYDASKYGTLDLTESAKDPTCWGGENSCWGGENTCWGGENEDKSIHGYAVTPVTCTASSKFKDVSPDPEKIFKVSLNANANQSNLEFSHWVYVKADGTKVELNYSSSDVTVKDMLNNNKIILLAIWKVTGQEGQTCDGGQNDAAGVYATSSSANLPAAPGDAR